MNDDIKPGKPENQLNPKPPRGENTPVYDQNQSNVHPDVTPAYQVPMQPASTEQPPQMQQPQQPPRVRRGFRLPHLPIPPALRGIFSTLQLLVGALLLAFAINAFVFQSYEVVGDSMFPTLSNGDRLVISKVGKSWSNTFGSDFVPARGSIVVFDSPGSDTKQLIKRVIGLPGEKVIVENGMITIINDAHPEGFNPDEDYSAVLPPDTTNKITTDVPEGHLFVAGDNRVGGNSLDSRNMLGTVPLKNVVGTLILRILPLSDTEFF